MNYRIALVVLIACMLLIPGCIGPVIKSTHINLEENTATTEPNEIMSKTNRTVIGYFLPKGIIRVQLRPEGGQELKLTIETKYINDPKYFYILSYLILAITKFSII